MGTSGASALSEGFNAKKSLQQSFIKRMSVLLIKQRISVSEAIWEIRAGNAHDSSLARWKARSRLPGYNWLFSLPLYGWGMIHRNRPLLKRVGHFEARYQVEGLRIPPTSIHNWLWAWFYYNTVAESLYIKKLCCKLYSIELEFYWQKRQISYLSHRSDRGGRFVYRRSNFFIEIGLKQADGNKTSANLTIAERCTPIN